MKESEERSAGCRWVLEFGGGRSMTRSIAVLLVGMAMAGCSKTADDSVVGEGRTPLDLAALSISELDKLCKAENREACLEAARRFEMDDMHRAQPYFAKACELGMGEGCLNAGMGLKVGVQGRPPDVVGGLVLLEKGCDLGVGESCGRAGDVICLGTAKSARSARAMYQRACQLGWLCDEETRRTPEAAARFADQLISEGSGCEAEAGEPSSGHLMDQFENRLIAGSALHKAWAYAADCRSAKMDVYKTLTSGHITETSPIAELGGNWTGRVIEGAGGFDKAGARAFWSQIDADQSMYSLNREHPLWAISASVIRTKADVHATVPDFFSSEHLGALGATVAPNYRWNAPSNAACREALRRVGDRIVSDCDSASTKRVDWIRFAARSECGLDPETPAHSACGSTHSLLVTKDAHKLPRWPRYTCRSRKAAGERWSDCLGFRVYSRSTHEDYHAEWYGCPGTKKCCPPSSEQDGEQ